MNKEEQMKSTSMDADRPEEGLVDQAKHVLSTVSDKAMEQVSEGLDTQRDKAVKKIGGLAEAIRWGSGLLKDVGPLGKVSSRAADGIEDVANFFENKQVGDVVRDVERFARREPAMFLGAAFALGLIGGRFLKSSTPRAAGVGGEPRHEAYGYGYAHEEEEYGAYGADGADFEPFDDIYAADELESDMPRRTTSTYTQTQARTQPRFEQTRRPEPPKKAAFKSEPLKTEAPKTEPMMKTEPLKPTAPRTPSTAPSTSASVSPSTATSGSTSGSIKPSPIVNAGTDTKPTNGIVGS